jgi:hypothetical protein
MEMILPASERRYLSICAIRQTQSVNEHTYRWTGLGTGRRIGNRTPVESSAHLHGLVNLERTAAIQTWASLGLDDSIVKGGCLDDDITRRGVRPAPLARCSINTMVAEAPNGAPMSTTASPSSRNHAIQRSITAGDGSWGFSPDGTPVQRSPPRSPSSFASTLCQIPQVRIIRSWLEISKRYPRSTCFSRPPG